MLATLAKTVLANLCCLLLLQQPWYKGFTGTIAQTAPHQYTTYVQLRRGSTLSRRNQLRLVKSLTHLPTSHIHHVSSSGMQCVELFLSLLTNFRATESLQAILTLLDLSMGLSCGAQELGSLYSRKTFSCTLIFNSTHNSLILCVESMEQFSNQWAIPGFDANQWRGLY